MDGRGLVRHIYLRQLRDTNEILFYQLLTRHLEEMLPIVHTPTAGAACRRFSEIHRKPRGLFLTYEDRHRFREILRNRPHREVDVLVVTDDQRILGLGDLAVLGAGSAAIGVAGMIRTALADEGPLAADG